MRQGCVECCRVLPESSLILAINCSSSGEGMAVRVRATSKSRKHGESLVLLVGKMCIAVSRRWSSCGRGSWKLEKARHGALFALGQGYSATTIDISMSQQ